MITRLTYHLPCMPVSLLTNERFWYRGCLSLITLTESFVCYCVTNKPKRLASVTKSNEILCMRKVSQFPWYYDGSIKICLLPNKP